MSTIDRSESPLELSVKDGAFYAVMFGLGELYVGACAVFLGASDASVGLIGTIPLCLGSLAQLLSAPAIERTGRRNPWIVGGAIVQALAWLPMIAAVFVPRSLAFPLLFGGFLLYMSSWHFTIPAWTSVMGDLVPSAVRGRYFSKRNAAAIFTQLLAAGVGAWTLTVFEARGHEALGFAVVFAGAMAARLMSTSYLRRIEEPVAAKSDVEPLSLWQFLSGAKTPNFTRFVYFTAGMMAAQYIAGSLFNIYWLRVLKYSYVEYGSLLGAIMLGQVLAFRFWGRIADRYGNRRVLYITATGISLHPLLWMASDHVAWGCFVQFGAGFSWAGFNLCVSNFLLDAVTPAQRTRCTAYMNLLNNAGLMLGGLLGASLIDVAPSEIGPIALRYPFWSLIILSCALRLAVVLFLHPRFREVRPVPEASWSEMLVHAIRTPETRVYVAPNSPDKKHESGVNQG